MSATNDSRAELLAALTAVKRAGGKRDSIGGPAVPIPLGSDGKPLVNAPNLVTLGGYGLGLWWTAGGPSSASPWINSSRLVNSAILAIWVWLSFFMGLAPFEPSPKRVFLWQRGDDAFPTPKTELYAAWLYVAHTIVSEVNAGEVGRFDGQKSFLWPRLATNVARGV